MTPLEAFIALPAAHGAGQKPGVTCVCSAHPLVIEAGLIEAHTAGQIPCIEATCNQVNQDGGYTGMTPADFRDIVMGIADTVGVPHDTILLGGDHLGPNPWRHLPAQDAMAKALVMTKAYAQAGFAKIHLDASMSCADDPIPLSNDVIAARAAALMAQSEDGATAGGHPPPAYIIGTEVPVPGGASEGHEHLVVSRPEDAAATVLAHVDALRSANLDHVWPRIVGLVVQPGVEFGQIDIDRYVSSAAAQLSEWRAAQDALVFEAHSTDYQPAQVLSQLVQDGFPILKVGPGLTFAMREAFYGLDAIAGEMSDDYVAGFLPKTMEAVMMENPVQWRSYVSGTEHEQKTQRHFGRSDRIRYLWPDPTAKAAMDTLLATLGSSEIPWSLISQHLGRLADDVADGTQLPVARDLVLGAIRAALAPYTTACQEG
ncbi:tagatose-bisphosphate aldolase noncatalytic subunit [Octadecabacter temperatus]|uniref:D-tagatose-1,6-bisphosphate aldolase subunit KbaZ n=1 Tax=Octadecabacter temperatus TaxID=1458307 RepID=A0A0K0Y7Y0_9RHOB|nr:class II D-tagatose-bisphosphate aldolase, non-catalytic subunit [Octadecabacter temperatus]AKS47079.1 D-tagatose-1,6-bisphosphate aldolase subunit KbaZ [Octadecabacter temperatus]SIO46740.1 tagatose-bisphosphate aldolase noncatalytic subunit [Octadecabacter temperatus]